MQATDPKLWRWDPSIQALIFESGIKGYVTLSYNGSQPNFKVNISTWKKH